MNTQDKTARAKKIAAIHVLKRNLGLEDAKYRELLKTWTGKSSSALLQDYELSRTIEYLRKMQDFEYQNAFIKPAKSYKTPYKGDLKGYKPHNSDAKRERYYKKIEAMLHDLNLHYNYVHGMAKRMFGLEFYTWCNEEQLYKIVQALSVYQYRKRRANS